MLHPETSSISIFSVLLSVFFAVALIACGPDSSRKGDPDAAIDAGTDISDVVSDAEPDADGDVLSDGDVTCVDACPGLGLTGCVDDGVATCGDPDGDGCLAWSDPVPCDPGLRCDPETVTCREPCGDFCAPFSIVILPDTQYYTSKQPNDADNTYRRQMQWVLDHRATDDIRFVLHVGDITNSNTTAQWQTASDAHAMLDAAGVPYSVVTGNHDYLVDGVFGRGDSQFDDWFPTSRFSANAWYGGSYGSSNINNYMFFSVGPMRFMVLSLEYSARKDVLCWADDLVAQHPDHHVILVTHCYLTHGGGYSGGCPDPDYNAVGATGTSVWNELVSHHSNIFLVVSGHIGDSEYREKASNTGAPVHEMLVDYQFEGECAAASSAACTNHCRTGTYHGNGWLRQLIFDPRANTVRAHTFTVEAGNTSMFPQGQPAFFCSELFNPPNPEQTGDNWYPSDPASAVHQFEFTYDFVDPPAVGVDSLDRTVFQDRTVNRLSAGDQLAPAVALTPDGAFVAVWQDDSSDTDGAGNHDIFLRGFAAGGCVGFADARVHTDGAGHQQEPAVAVDAAGNFVVAWADDTDGNGVFQIHARGFFADGTPRFTIAPVNTVATGQQKRPSVGMAPDGRFVIAWEDDPASDGNGQVLFRGFHADGAERFADRSAHDDAVGARLRPRVGLDGNANIVIAWQDDSDGNGAFQIHARGFTADGAPRFGRITVNSVPDGQQVEPALGVAADGTFVVAWRDDADSDGRYRILARGFTAAGAGRLLDFTVSATAGQHRAPAVTVSPEGAFLVAWSGDPENDGDFDVFAVHYAADGATSRALWTVNREVTGAQRAPAVALNDAGSQVFLWEDDMDDNGTYQLVGRGY
jgi:hypothetical protein